MKGSIIVAGGDAERKLLIKSSLEPHGFATKLCQSLDEFSAEIQEIDIIAVLMLCPDEDEIIEKCYNKAKDDIAIDEIPIITISLTRRDNEYVRSICSKANEFLIEPISSIDLITIIEQAVDASLLKPPHAVLSFGDLELDRISLKVTLRNIVLSIDPIPARILEFLMLPPGRVFTRKEISSWVWGAGNSVDDRAIDVFVGRIRDALKHKVAVDPIRTVRDVGYALNEQFSDVGSIPKKGSVMQKSR